MRTRHQDLDNRFGYLREFAREFNVNGAILYIIRFCAAFEYDAVEMRDRDTTHKVRDTSILASGGQ